MRLVARAVFCSTLLLLLFPIPSHAQSDNFAYANLQFNIANPGARSLALAGAFVSLADDATAAYANPAGLTQLVKPQFSMEVRNTRTGSPFTSGGSFGCPAGQTCSDPGAGLQRSVDISKGTSPTYASIMYPHGRWAIGAYRHEFADYSVSFETGRVLLPALGSGVGLVPFTTGVQLKITNWGIAGSVNLTDNLAVGGGVTYQKDSLHAEFNTGTFLATDDASDAGFGGSCGVLFHAGRFSAGAAVRHSPAFKFENHSNFPLAAAAAAVQNRGSGTFGVPDSYSLGASFRITETFTVSTELQEVKYKRLTKQVISEIGATLDANSFRSEDADELRVGLEKAFFRPSGAGISIRLGSWYEPAHSIEYRGSGQYLSTFGPYFRPGESRTHVTGGVGIVGKGWQVDVGVDYARNSRIASISLVRPF
jgi:long-chain fatty acid transport protein